MTRKYEPPYPELARELRAWLKEHPEHGHEVRDFAQKHGFTFNTARKWFGGAAFPTGDAYERLRDLTQIIALQTAPRRRNPGDGRARVPLGVSQPLTAKVDAEDSFESRKRLLVALRTWLGANPGVTREDLAHNLGMGLRTLHKWLAGEAYPRDVRMRTAITRETGIAFGRDGPELPGQASVHSALPAIQVPKEVKEAAQAMLELTRALQPVIRGPPMMR